MKSTSTGMEAGLCFKDLLLFRAGCFGSLQYSSPKGKRRLKLTEDYCLVLSSPHLYVDLDFMLTSMAPNIQICCWNMATEDTMGAPG